jgi:hypothetical protein
MAYAEAAAGASPRPPSTRPPAITS